jgi:hypothetical protein
MLYFYCKRNKEIRKGKLIVIWGHKAKGPEVKDSQAAEDLGLPW